MIIGIIGGGQLGMMMAEAAQALEFQTIGLDPAPHCPLSYAANGMISAPYDDKEAFSELVRRADVLTYEFENVDEQLIKKYEHAIPQKVLGLQKSKDRMQEKTFISSLDIPTPNYHEYVSSEDLFIPSIIKTTTGGYDGKGQFVIRHPDDINHFQKSENKRYIIEEHISFDYEISVIMTRAMDGTMVHYPIPKNYHQNGILLVSEITGDVPSAVSNRAVSYTKQIAEALDYVGTLAVEFFVRKDNVIFNEFAPRPHNSGHYTIEGCSVSQFMNHIRAISGMSLEEPRLLQPTLMINELGQHEDLEKRMDTQHCTYHGYHKHPRKNNRKMGHITCTCETKETLENRKISILGASYEQAYSN